MAKKFELDSKAGQLESFRQDLRALLEKSGLKEKSVSEVLLAVQEAVTNVIRHSSHDAKNKITVNFEDHDDNVKISIRDFGKKFDITQVPDPELPRSQPGGLGIYLIKNVMDEVRYDGSCEEGNLLHLIKYKNRSH